MTFEIRRLTDLPTAEIRWLWPAWIPRGALTLLEGQPGVNKSTLLSDLAARVTTGRPMPRLTGPAAPGDVWLFSPEGLTAQIRSRLAAAEADLERVHVIGQGTGGFVLQRDFEQLQAAVARNPPQLFVIDPLVECLEGTMMSERRVRLAFPPLVALAQRHGFAIVGVRHLTKSAPANPLYRGSGQPSRWLDRPCS